MASNLKHDPPTIAMKSPRGQGRAHALRGPHFAAATAAPLPTSSQIQSFCAQAALFFLPLPAIKYTETSLTLADLFLIPAILLNFGHAMRLHAFQIPFLLALPINLLSHMLDPSGELISILQVIYLWGFLVPHPLS